MSSSICILRNFRRGLTKTIILNSKTLIEKDGDFAKFSLRILLSYMYEESLGWNIADNTIDELKSSHVEGFKSYLKRGVRLNVSTQIA